MELVLRRQSHMSVREEEIHVESDDGEATQNEVGNSALFHSFHYTLSKSMCK